MKRFLLVALCATLFFALSGCADCGGDLSSGNPVAPTDRNSRDASEPDSSEPDLCELAKFYLDEDGDGFGDPNRWTQQVACDAPEGYVQDNTDCDDAQEYVNPDMGESCNGRDDDCDGTVDNGWPTITVYRDADRDSFGDPEETLTVTDCQGQGIALPIGYVRDGSDCDDADPDVYPSLCYPDTDGDGHGDDQADGVLRCACEDSESALNDDCDDQTRSVHPDAIEVCDVTDNDCDGDVDEGLMFAQHRDDDHDGFGRDGMNNTVYACVPVEGYAFNTLDCDDGDESINPDAEEMPGDGVDQNCDGHELCFLDQDQDGDRSESETVLSANVDCDDPGLTNEEASVDCLDTDEYFNTHDVDGDGESTCDDPPDCDDTDPLNTTKDFDHDGFSACDPNESRRDCNDLRNDVHPDSAETLCDGVDNDCDGDVDEGLKITVCLDVDEDGYGDPEACEEVCPGAIPVGYVPNSDDCDVIDPTAHPEATEDPADGLDSDCDGFESCYADEDGDGFGQAESLVTDSQLDCSSEGRSALASDCDDANAAISPLDNDHDGFAGCVSAPAQADCDDTDASNYPGAPEYCDGVDNDCDGESDELFLVDVYPDNDHDGYGDQTSEPEPAPVCPGVEGLDQLPEDFADNNLDCDDADSDVNADDDDGDGASECDPDPDCDDGNASLNLLDEDGDGATTCDEEPDCDDLDMLLNQLDSDGDGATTCDPDPDCDDADFMLNPSDLDRDGYFSCPPGPLADCHDGNPTFHPGAYDIPNDGFDQDCNGSDLTSPDIDNDGDGLTENQGDCNDSRSDIGANQPESCDDKVDNDCDGLVNEVCDDFDHDGDCYCAALSCLDSANEVCALVQPGDCDDTDAATYPGAPEVPRDGLDQDCNGSDLTDPDIDDDGDLMTENQGDCNDSDPTVYLGAQEIVGDNIDQDCDGRELCYQDADGDLYGINFVVTDTNVNCDDGSAPTASQAGDCNDLNSVIHPNANETLADNLDQDCDGFDSCFLDEDGDGYGSLTVVVDTDLFCDNDSAPTARVDSDCDDTRSDINPGAVEICDGQDNNCVAGVDEDDVCAPPTDASQPDTYSGVDAGSAPDTYAAPDTNSAPDASQPDTYSGVDAGSPDVNAPDTASNPDSAMVPDAGSSDSAMAPDAAGEDGGDTIAWGDQDRDGDGIANAVDVINVLDLDETPGAETVCVPAHLVMAAPWNQESAYLQGTPEIYWSGLKSLEGAVLDPLTPIPGATGLSEWCHDFTNEHDSNYIYRYIGRFGVNGMDPVRIYTCSDWVRSDISTFCSAHSDAYCRHVFASDGCARIQSIIGVHWEDGVLSPM